MLPRPFGNVFLAFRVKVIGLFGLSRVSELCDLTFEDISLSDEIFTFFIRKSKTDQAKKGFYFHAIPPFLSTSKLIMTCFPFLKEQEDFSDI
jgi:hypothetical protein